MESTKLREIFPLDCPSRAVWAPANAARHNKNKSRQNRLKATPGAELACILLPSNRSTARVEAQPERGVERESDRWAAGEATVSAGWSLPRRRQVRPQRVVARSRRGTARQ